MRRTLRGLLLGWLLVLMAGVLGTFGTALYLRQRALVRAKVEGGLEGLALTLAGAVEQEETGRLEFDLGERDLAPLLGKGRRARWFLVWGPDGEILGRSAGAPDRARPEALGLRRLGHRREFALAGRSGVMVLVGRDAREEEEELGEFLTGLFLAGGLVLLLSLGGGWLLVGRVLAPIRRMSAAAAEISAANLCGRIDIGKTESELARLAATLNGTFARLEAAFARQARFTADASHELRTPVSVVISQAELALRKDRTPGEYREALEACLRAGRRLERLAAGLLTLARFDACAGISRRERVDLGETAAETLSFLRPLAEDRGIALRLQGDSVPVEGDPDRLREALTNLVENAILYNRPGGEVEVALVRDGAAALLEIRDTGPGIPEADRPRLFERFHRVDRARSRGTGGAGLGLSIAKAIIEAHGGTIGFRADPGRGTTFALRLPSPAGS